MTTPRRMCAGCRGRADKPELVRLVWDGAGSVMADERQRRSGRGVYLHRDCAARTPSRAVARGLRRALDADAVHAVLRTLGPG